VPLVAGWAQSAPCPSSIKREVVGEKFQWVQARESGIRPTGFVDVPGITVVHGVDLSGDKDLALLGNVWTCGGRFAYVLMSSGDKDQNERGNFFNWRRARNEGFYVGAMHQLLLYPPGTGDIDAYARDQARLFVQNWLGIMVSQDNRSEEPPAGGEPPASPETRLSVASTFCHRVCR
jgi:hypothetical protein